MVGKQLRPTDTGKHIVYVYTASYKVLEAYHKEPLLEITKSKSHNTPSPEDRREVTDFLKLLGSEERRNSVRVIT